MTNRDYTTAFVGDYVTMYREPIDSRVSEYTITLTKELSWRQNERMGEDYLDVVAESIAHEIKSAGRQLIKKSKEEGERNG